MTSISRDKNGTKRLVFNDPHGKRHFVRLGNVTVKQAETIKAKIENIVSAKILGVPFDAEISKWLMDIGDDLHEKLAKTEIVFPRESAILKPFIDRYVSGRKDVKPATKEVWRQGISGLLEFFGENKRLQDIGAGDADDYKQFLIGKGLAPYTVRKRLQFANTIFIAAQRRGVIAQNPFSGVTVQARVILESCV